VDVPSECFEPLLQPELGLLLRDEQEERKGTGHAPVVGAQQRAVLVGHDEAAAPQSVVDEGVGDVDSAQVLQRPWLHRRGSRPRRRGCGPIDDHVLDAELGEAGGQGKARGPGPDHENVGVGGDGSWHPLASYKRERTLLFSQ
jgi:hypothetical protein